MKVFSAKKYIESVPKGNRRGLNYDNLIRDDGKEVEFTGENYILWDEESHQPTWLSEYEVCDKEEWQPYERSKDENSRQV